MALYARFEQRPNGTISGHPQQRISLQELRSRVLLHRKLPVAVLCSELGLDL